jgi:hypothetical protein
LLCAGATWDLGIFPAFSSAEFSVMPPSAGFYALFGHGFGIFWLSYIAKYVIFLKK